MKNKIMTLLIAIAGLAVGGMGLQAQVSGGSSGGSTSGSTGGGSTSPNTPSTSPSTPSTAPSTPSTAPSTPSTAPSVPSTGNGQPPVQAPQNNYNNNNQGNRMNRPNTDNSTWVNPNTRTGARTTQPGGVYGQTPATGQPGFSNGPLVPPMTNSVPPWTNGVRPWTNTTPMNNGMQQRRPGVNYDQNPPR